MNWTRTKLTRWTYGAFKITEDPDSSAGAFRLDSLGDRSEWFGTWREAQRAAALKNELALTRAENERLRAELAQARVVWPAPAAGDDGHGIPARHGTASRNGTAPATDEAGEMDQRPLDDGFGDDDGAGPVPWPLDDEPATVPINGRHAGSDDMPP